MNEERNSTGYRIFLAALELFATYGYHPVSMRDIAQKVNIRASSIYHHFESKDSFLLEVYQYFDEHMAMYTPDLNKLLQMVETQHPHDVMWKSTILYPAEELPLLSCAMRITADLSHTDDRAERLIRKNLLDIMDHYDRPLLCKMLELDKIEPLDIEAFTLVRSNFSYSAAVRFYSNHQLQTPDYLKGLEMIFSLIRVKEPQQYFRIDANP